MERRSVLESWKEISAYLRRNVRTCQLWERGHGLPIHRLDNSPKSRVFAYADELDAWLEERLNRPAPAVAPPQGRGHAKALPILPRRNKRLIAALAVVALAGIATSARFAWHHAKTRWAEEVALPKIEALLQARNIEDAFGLAIRAERYMPGDPELNRLLAVLCGSLLVETEPPGATVSLGTPKPGAGSWLDLGVSPVMAKHVRAGACLWKAGKPGYEPAAGTVTILAGTANKLRISLIKKN